MAVPNAVPEYIWSSLTQNDKETYLKLKESFYYSNSPILCKEKDKSTFPSELETIRAYIDSDSIGVEERSIAVGISFQPSFLSVNIQRLKILLNRCKSSINKGFQQINYISEKSRVKTHVVKSIPLLSMHPEEIRQWTIRIPSKGSYDLTNNMMHMPLPQKSTDIIKNINLGNDQIMNETLLLPQNRNNLLPTPFINSNNSIQLVSEQSCKPNHQQQALEYVKGNNHTISAVQNPPEIRLCNSQYIESNFSIDDFDISNGHEFGINDDDSAFLCSSCHFNENTDNNTYDLLTNFHDDDMYAEYHNHDDPQDDDIGLNNMSDHNGSSIDIRNNITKP